MSDMQEPLDNDLMQLFDTANTSLEADRFLEQVQGRLEEARVAQRRRWIGLGVVLLVLAAAATPYVAAGSLAVAQYAGGWLLDFNSGLVSPAGWIGSALAAIWLLRRTRVFGR